MLLVSKMGSAFIMLYKYIINYYIYVYILYNINVLYVCTYGPSDNIITVGWVGGGCLSTLYVVCTK